MRSSFFCLLIPFLSSSNLIFSVLPPPSFSHQSVEGQRARGLHHTGQPFLPRGIRPGHEGGLPTTHRPTEQKRSPTLNLLSTFTNSRISPIKGTQTCFLVGDLTTELVRHFLIETSAKGVRLKGCPNEPYFGECLPCRLLAWRRRASVLCLFGL